MNSKENPGIMIAGSRGMVGSTIRRKLEKNGYSNFILCDISDVDLRRQNDTEKFFESTKPEYVFLAAAKVGGIVANDTYKADFIADNIAIALNVLSSALKSGVKKLLNLGSSCIYPKFAPQPMKEEHLLTGELEPTNEPYAIAKIAAIKMCRYFNEQYGSNFISVMPTNLYGLNDNYNLETSHVLPALVRKAILSKALAAKDMDFIKSDLQKNRLGFGLDEKIELADESSIISALEQAGATKDYISVWGSGEVRREFMHADDMAAACVYFMEKYDFDKMGEFVNIGVGEDVSIKELVYLIKDIVGFGGEVRFDSSKPDGTPRKLLDVSRATALGWKAKIDLETGVRSVVERYLS